MNKVELYKIKFLIDKYKKIQQQDKPFKAFRNTPDRILVDIIKDLNELLRSAAELNQAADAIIELMAENAELREALAKANNRAD